MTMTPSGACVTGGNVHNAGTTRYGLNYIHIKYFSSKSRSNCMRFNSTRFGLRFSRRAKTLNKN